MLSIGGSLSIFLSKFEKTIYPTLYWEQNQKEENTLPFQ